MASTDHQGTLTNQQKALNPRPAGVFSRTRPAGGHILPPPPPPNSRTNRRSEAGEAAIESTDREDSNAYQKFSLKGHV